jgi:N-formylglutamate deformylase
VVFTSAHSGRYYPPDFLAAARLDAHALRRSEDSFVDELFADVPGSGVPLLIANFPRAFCDVNREAWELDPAMFADPVPDWVNSASHRVHAGLGMMARVVSNGEPIYRAKLPFAEARRRVREYWQPFHTALSDVVAHLQTQFGCCLVVDCHSMPRQGGGPVAADFVLGDLFGRSCAPTVSRALEAAIQSKGYRVRRNNPYAGGYITRQYGQPHAGSHAMQIEIARDLYMDEPSLRKTAGFDKLRQDVATLITTIVMGATDWMQVVG